MNYNIRIIKNNELKYLSNFLYEAIFIPEGFSPPPKSIINSPELQIYIKAIPHNCKTEKNVV